jgi:hypothetical protein
MELLMSYPMKENKQLSTLYDYTWEKSGFGGNSAQNQQFEDLYFTVLLDRCLMDIYSTSQVL